MEMDIYLMLLLEFSNHKNNFKLYNIFLTCQKFTITGNFTYHVSKDNRNWKEEFEGYLFKTI